MGIILGALAGAGKAAGEIADANTKLWGQQELEAQRADIAAKRDAALAAMQEQSSIRAEGRGLVNRAQERKNVFDETMTNAPALRQVKTEDAKAAKMVELDPEIQALMRKAENEKLTSAEQAKLDFYTQNKKEILGKKRDEARAGDIDHGAGLRSVQIDIAKLSLAEKQAEAKMPPAVKAQAEALREQIRAKAGVIDKATVDGMADPAGVAKLQKERDVLSAQVAALYAPYIPGAAKPEAPKPDNSTPDPFPKGTIKNGFEYLGGGVNNKDNWKPVEREKPKKTGLVESVTEYVPPPNSPAAKILAERKAAQQNQSARGDEEMMIAARRRLAAAEEEKKAAEAFRRANKIQ